MQEISKRLNVRIKIWNLKKIESPGCSLQDTTVIVVKLQVKYENVLK